MTNKEKLLAEEIAKLNEKTLKQDSELKELMEKITKAEQEGVGADELKKKMNSEFAKALKGAKNEKDLIGKGFFVKKEAKLGNLTFEENYETVSVDSINSYDIASSAFGETRTKGNSIGHTVHQGRSIIKNADGTPIEECALNDECDYNYSKVNFPIKKYSCYLPTSLEFIEFVNGGAKNAINSLVTDTNNLFTKFSLNADDQINNYYGLFNVNTDRSFPRVNSTATINGLFTADDLIAMRGVQNGSLRATGFYFMSNSAYTIVETLKDGQGNLIFAPGSNGQTIANYSDVGTIKTRPIFVIPDDVWYKAGLTETSVGAPMVFYGTKEAFEYYINPIDMYTQYISDIFDEGNVLIQVAEARDSDGKVLIGCIELHALILRGFGVTAPQSGVILQNTVEITSSSSSQTYASLDAKSYGDLIADLSIDTVDSEGNSIPANYTFESPEGISVLSGTLIPVGLNQEVIVIATATDSLIAGVTSKLKLSITVTS